MNDEMKILFLSEIIKRFRNVSDVMIATGSEWVPVRMNERDVKELLYLLEDYLFILKGGTT